MAMQTLSNPADVANRLQTYFQRKMLEPLKNTLILDRFAMGGTIPKNSGGRTCRWFRRRVADASNVQSLTEGVAINTFTEVTTGYVEATLAQIGEAAKISDILQAVDIFDWLQQNITVMGEEAALKYDTVLRNAIQTGMADSNGNFERFAGVVNTGNSGNDFTSLAALAAASAKITRARALACVTQLRQGLVPTIGGKYVAVICPQVLHDLRQDDDWKNKAIYSRPTQMEGMDAIELDGVGYVEGTNPFRETAYKTYAANGAVYNSYFLGREAYGSAKLSGSGPGLGSPAAPQIMINNKPDKSDPANQFTVVAWKAYYAGVLFLTNLSGDVPHLVIFRSKSTFA